MVITYENKKAQKFTLDSPNTDGWKVLESIFYICSNDDCKRLSLVSELYSWRIIEYSNWNTTLDTDSIKHEKTWNLIPNSKAKIFPEYIPKVILDDYNESCLIQTLSPKASATLSRRCLQWIIRDFWWIKKWRLIDEINELENTIDPLIYQAIDWTRKIWNIWAHMEKDINLIIDVDEDEADKLIKLIEILLKECYITRHEREQNLTAIIWISEEKDEAKNSKNTE